MGNEPFSGRVQTFLVMFQNNVTCKLHYLPMYNFSPGWGRFIRKKTFLQK